jgi:hypothetical protein
MTTLTQMLLIVLFGVVSANAGCAQTRSPSPSPQSSPPTAGPSISIQVATPAKSFGKTEVYYDATRKRTKAKVDFYVIGRPEDALKTDVLSLTIEMEGPGRRPVKAESIIFSLYSYSHGKSYKYKSDPKLTIFLDDTLLLSDEFQPFFMAIDPRGGVTEHYLSARIPYDKLLQILKAKKIVMKFGSTTFEIQGENLEALRDLNKSIKH